MQKKQHCQGAHICLVGKNLFQNEMFIVTLKRIHQCKNSFSVITSIAEIPEIVRNITDRKVLFYLDCFGLRGGDLGVLLDSAHQIICPGNVLALFNLAEGSGIEKEALTHGIYGFFYLNNSPADFCKGTRSLLNGEIWLSRKIMSELLMAGIHPISRQHLHEGIDTAELTPREKDVLAHLASGGTNEALAAELCISVHTLRTHLYNIYRKINVHNRILAAQWAENNL